jgi:hypothetical protein
MPFLTRGQVCHLELLLVFASTVIVGFESHGTHDQILLSQIWDSPNRVGQLYPQAPGSLFVTYDSQSYGWGISTHLHMEVTATADWSWV